MKIAPYGLSRFVVALTGLFIAHNLTGQIQNESATSTNEIKVKASSTAVQADSDREKRFKELKKELNRLAQHSTPQTETELEKGVRQMLKEFPERVEGYDFMMSAIETANAAKARSLAKEMIDSPAPERFKAWAKGLLNRLDSMGKPMTIQFKAVDGREVDSTKMRGKVVLVDFWATDCPPCVRGMPLMKRVYEKFHGRGFEIIGISCDKKAAKLTQFLERENISWPQYFDGKAQDENKFTQAFGINGIPYLMLLDKNGCLRYNGISIVGSEGLRIMSFERKNLPADNPTMIRLEDKIAELLAE